MIPLLINVAPNGDLFHPEINKKQLFKIFDVIRQTPQHQYLILTRRPQRINKLKLHIPDNVWLGVSIADKNEWSLFNELKNITATTKVVALAPASNHYELNMPFEGISWVIIVPDNRRSRKATPCSIDTVEHPLFSMNTPMTVPVMITIPILLTVNRIMTVIPSAPPFSLSKLLLISNIRRKSAGTSAVAVLSGKK